MEIRKKKISLAGLFGRYIFMFVTGTFFAALISGAVMFFLILIPSGPFSSGKLRGAAADKYKGNASGSGYYRRGNDSFGQSLRCV